MDRTRARFDRLVAPHADALWALARRLEGDPVAADDLLQAALLRALTQLDSLRDDAAARAWAARILVRAWLDRRRRSTPAALEVDPASSAPDPEAQLRARQIGDRLGAAFDALPAEQRAAVWLVDAEGFTFGEAADALGIAPGTAASRVARGRATLRLLLHDLHGSSS